MQHDRRPKVSLARPPGTWTTGRARRAQNALVQAIELRAFFRRLQPLAGGRRALRAQPRLDRCVLGIKMGEVGHQVLHHRHVRQGVDRHFLFRSEEHTSELQSLMRTSYAVLCLNNKTHTTSKKSTYILTQQTSKQ